MENRKSIECLNLIRAVDKEYGNTQETLDLYILIEVILNNEEISEYVRSKILEVLLSKGRELEKLDRVFIPKSSLTRIYSTSGLHIISNEESSIYVYSEDKYRLVYSGEIYLSYDQMDIDEVVSVTQVDLDLKSVSDYISLFKQVVTSLKRDEDNLLTVITYFRDYLSTISSNDDIQTVLDLVGSYTSNKGRLSKIRSINRENYAMGISEYNSIMPSNSVLEITEFIFNILSSLESSKDLVETDVDTRLYYLNNIEKMLNRVKEVDRTKIVLSLIYKWYTKYSSSKERQTLGLHISTAYYKSTQYVENRFNINYNISYYILSALINTYVVEIIVSANINYYQSNNTIQLGIMIEIASTMLKEYALLFLQNKININFARIEFNRAYSSHDDYSTDYYRLEQMKSRINEIESRISTEILDTRSRNELETELEELNSNYELFSGLESEIYGYADRYDIISERLNEIEDEMDYYTNRMQIISATQNQEEYNNITTALESLRIESSLLDQEYSEISNDMLIQYHDVLGYKEMIKYLALMIRSVSSDDLYSRGEKKDTITNIFKQIKLFYEEEYYDNSLDNGHEVDDIILYTRTILTKTLEPVDMLPLMVTNLGLEPIDAVPITDKNLHPFNIMMSDIFKLVDTEVNLAKMGMQSGRGIKSLISKVHNVIESKSIYYYRGTYLHTIIKEIFTYSHLSLIRILVAISIYHRYAKLNENLFLRFDNINDLNSDVANLFADLLAKIFSPTQISANLFFVLDSLVDIVGYDNLMQYSHSIYRLDSFIMNVNAQNRYHASKFGGLIYLDIDEYLRENTYKYHIITADSLFIYITGIMIHLKKNRENYSTRAYLFRRIYDDIYYIMHVGVFLVYFETHPHVLLRILSLLSNIDYISMSDTILDEYYEEYENRYTYISYDEQEIDPYYYS